MNTRVFSSLSLAVLTGLLAVSLVAAQNTTSAVKLTLPRLDTWIAPQVPVVGPNEQKPLEIAPVLETEVAPAPAAPVVPAGESQPVEAPAPPTSPRIAPSRFADCAPGMTVGICAPSSQTGPWKFAPAMDRPMSDAGPQPAPIPNHKGGFDY